MKFRNLILLLESASFIVLGVLFLVNLFIKDESFIKIIESMRGHSLNYFTIDTMLVFRRIFLLIILILLIIATYLKLRTKKIDVHSIGTSIKVNKNLILIALIIFFIIMQLIFFAKVFVDDAFISFRYAKNLVNTEQLTFNIDETPVEGYTHVLWIFLLAIPYLFNINILIFTKIISFVFAILTLLLIYKLSNNNSIPVLLCITSASVMAWATTGLETSMYSALALLSILFFLRGKFFLCSLSILLTTLTRPEAVIIFLIMLIFSIKENRANILKLLVPFTSIYLIYTLLRFWYFSAFLPNTYYAKYIFLGGISDILSFIFYICPMIVIILLYKKLYKIRLNSTDYFIISIIIATTIVYTNIHPTMGFYYRFLQLPLLLTYVLVSKPIYEIGRKLLTLGKKYNIQLFCIIIISLFFSYNAISLPRSIIHFNIMYIGMEQGHITLGKWLKDKFPENYTIAVSDVGAIPYYSELKTIDIQGLVNSNLSRKFSIDYILNKNPELIILASSNHTKFTQVPTFYYEDFSIFNNSRFHSEYVFINRTFEHTSPIIFWVFQRRGAV